MESHRRILPQEIALTRFRRNPASFRDPDASVFHHGDRVLRAFQNAGKKRYDEFSASGLPEKWTAGGSLLPSTPLSDEERERFAPGAPLLLEHPRIPFLSWCYEWSFEMLRAAALLELDLFLEALEKDFLLKDATPYNVQFRGTDPVHIDVTSFARREEGSPWLAYGQFCHLFLNPLLLSASTEIPFTSRLRGSLGGISPGETRKLLPWYRRGIFLDVTLQAWAQRSFSRSDSSLSRLKKEAPVRRESLARTGRRLRRIIHRLRRPNPGRGWSRYEDEKIYSAEGAEFKDAFVDRWCGSFAPSTVWDLGCNTGRYSRIAARHADHVLAVDASSETIDELFLALRGEGNRTVQCLVMDLADPSPARGWAGREREAFTDRGKPGLLLALALFHHLRIAAGIPLRESLPWMAKRAEKAILEFVPKEDRMARRLLQWREDIFDDYTAEGFESELKKSHRILERAAIPGTGRVLYAVEAEGQKSRR